MNSLLRYIKKRKDITVIFLILAIVTAIVSSKLSVYLGYFFDLASGSINMNLNDTF